MRINCLQADPCRLHGPARVPPSCLPRRRTRPSNPVTPGTVPDRSSPRKCRDPAGFPGQRAATGRATGRERTAGRSCRSRRRLPTYGLFSLFRIRRGHGLQWPAWTSSNTSSRPAERARTAQLLSAGYSRRDIGRLHGPRCRRSHGGEFSSHPDCDPDLAAAIRHNGRLTCASAAARYGLWLRNPPARLHLACNHGHGRGFIRHRTVRFDGHPGLADSCRGRRNPARARMPGAAVVHGLGDIGHPTARYPLGATRRTSFGETGPAPDPAGAARSGPARGVHCGSRCAAPFPDQRHRFRRPGIPAGNRTGGFPPCRLPDRGNRRVRVPFTARDMLRDRDRNNASTVQGFAVLRYMPEAHLVQPGAGIWREIRAVLAARNGKAHATRAFQPS